ncbi:MAG: hypothetical protein WD013_04695 [Gemmatimonadota bacterium]
MLPGGYDFIHLIFWPIVGMVAIGTNLIPIVLGASIGLLVLETVKGEETAAEKGAAREDRRADRSNP